MKRIIISENQLEYIKTHTQNNSAEVFNKEVRRFVYNLLKKDINDISDYWLINGIKKSDLYNKLKTYGIIRVTSDNEILVPKRNFDSKIERFYYELFPDQEPGLIISEDDGGAGDGATSAMNSGSYETPLFGGVIKKKFNNN